MNTSPSIAANVAEFDMSGLEAMLAGTLCLMSAYSHCSCNDTKQTTNQGLLSLKIVSNLTCLQYQTCLSPEFRKVLSKVCKSWRQHCLLTQSEQAPNASASAMKNAMQASHLHAAPSTVQ